MKQAPMSSTADNSVEYGLVGGEQDDFGRACVHISLAWCFGNLPLQHLSHMTAMAYNTADLEDEFAVQMHGHVTGTAEAVDAGRIVVPYSHLSPLQHREPV